MAVQVYNGTTSNGLFTPVSSALANLPNAAATVAILARQPSTAGDFVGLLDSTEAANWYHTLSTNATPKLFDDDGLVGITTTTANTAQAQGAGNYQIMVVDWGTGTALERFHWSSLMSAAESWTHDPSSVSNGGLRAGPGTTGHWKLGFAASQGRLNSEIALVGVWAGTRFTDTDVTNLWVNKNTSDWWNHPAGQPTMLIECNTLTPVDIGTAPSTFSALTNVALTGPDPTGWTFDGRGAAAGAHSTFTAIPFMH